MAGEGYTTRRAPRWGLIALLAGLHVLALLGLARAFAPDFTAAVIEEATSLVTVTITSPPPPPTPPPPPPRPSPDPEPDEGSAGEEGREAVAREQTAPEPRIVLAPSPVPLPRAPSTDLAASAGTRDQGTGSGAGGEGAGSGAGRGGDGTGGLPVTRPVKIAGEINNAADYPVPPGGRAMRLGHTVTITMTVTVDGRATDCRVIEPSPDPEADRITCELAEERFRFEPARNAAGQPVASVYGWRQAWFRR